jgi:hypothetical protein
MVSRAELELDCKPGRFKPTPDIMPRICAVLTMARGLAERGAVQSPIVRIFSLSAS